MEIISNMQVHVTVYAGTRVPAAVGLTGIINLYSNDIPACEFKMTCQAKNKGGVTVILSPDIFTIDPDIAVHIDTVKLNGYLFSLPFLRYFYIFAVKPQTPGQIASFIGSRVVRAESLFNTPVMRQIKDPPGCVIKVRLHGL